MQTYRLVVSDIFSSIEVQDRTIPVEWGLRPNFPNPFNSVTTFNFVLDSNGHVRLTIYSLLGERVATLIDRYENKGSHRVLFDAQEYSLATGLYICHFETQGRIQTHKMLYIR